MKGKIKFILLGIAAVALIGGLIAVTLLTGSVEKNPPGTVGNLPGNVYNNGLFCELDGKIYFANPYDGDSVYSMDRNLTNVKKLNSAKTKLLNAAGKYIYYYQYGSGQSGSGSTGGLGYVRGVRGYFRADLNGNHATSLIGDDMTSAILIDNYIYLNHYDKETNWMLVKIALDKDDPIVIIPENVNPAGASASTIYYTKEFGDHNIYALDTRSDSSRQFFLFNENANLWFPTPDGGYLYCLNAADNYKLCRLAISDGHIETLTQDRVDCFNIKDGKIYYSKNDADNKQYALMRMNSDGSNPEMVQNGSFCDINMAGDYVFYHEFNNPVPLYFQSINGPVAPATFNIMPQ